MQSKKFSTAPKSIFWTDLATSIVLPLVVSHLYSTGFYLSLGQFSSLNFIIFMAVSEIIKYVINVQYSDGNIHCHSVKICVKMFATIVLGCCVIYIVTVLFGAAAFSKVEETTTFSLLVTTVTILPSCLHLGPEATVNLLNNCDSVGKTLEKCFQMKIFVTGLGAWFGAFVIPLDWNRPWQKWPIPVCFGAIVGYIVANWICLYLHFAVTKKSKKYILYVD